MAGDKASRIWKEVRRTLGRLASRTVVHDLSPAHTQRVVVKNSFVTAIGGATIGAREDSWRPAAETVLWPIPAAEEGGRGADLASVATVISANAAWASETGTVCCPAWRIEACEPQAWDLSQAILPPPDVAAHHVQVGALTLPVARFVITADPLYSVLVRFPALPKPAPKSVRTWALPLPRSWSDLGIMERVPVVRDSLTPPIGQVPGQAFAAECRQLALSAQTEESDVLLLGVFPQVPLAMVEKLSVVADERVRLQIWLKPAALKAGPKGVKLATIILGRQRSTGRTLQAVSRSAVPTTGSR